MRISVPALALILPFTAAAQTFRVSGTVVDSESGSPLNRTLVVLTGGAVAELRVITTSEGRFSFDVPKGKYSLRARHHDWGDVYGEPVPGSDSGSAIIAGPDRDTAQLLFRFRAPVAIRGKIVDTTGEPIFSATVEVFLRKVVAGKMRLTSLGQAGSDDFGNYSYWSLPAGTYYFAATGAPWYFSDNLFDARDKLTDAGTPPVPYALTFFPGTRDPSAATPIVLRPGVELQVDFTLSPAGGVNLHLVCPKIAECNGSVSLYAIGPGRAQTFVRTADLTVNPVVPAVEPGRYMLRYTGDEGHEGVMRKVIDVAGDDITVEIEPEPVPTIAGKVIFQNPGDRPRHPMYVNMLDEDTGQSLAVALGSDGAFSWPVVTAQHARLFLSGEDGFFIARMSVEGASMKNGVVEVKDGAAVKVSLLASHAIGRLSGFVNDKDRPAPGVLVVLAPAVDATDPFRYLALQSESDGSFEFPHVPAGDYVLFSVDNLKLEYATPEVIRPYFADGKRVRIEAHAIQTESIGLSLALRN